LAPGPHTEVSIAELGIAIVVQPDPVLPNATPVEPELELPTASTLAKWKH
jgi:hypothetical protein